MCASRAVVAVFSYIARFLPICQDNQHCLALNSTHQTLPVEPMLFLYHKLRRAVPSLCARNLHDPSSSTWNSSVCLIFYTSTLLNKIVFAICKPTIIMPNECNISIHSLESSTIENACGLLPSSPDDSSSLFGQTSSPRASPRFPSWWPLSSWKQATAAAALAPPSSPSPELTVPQPATAWTR